MLVVSSKSNLTCEAGCGLTVLWSDYSRIFLGSVSDRPRIGNDVSSVFKDCLRNLRMEFCVAGAVFGEVLVSHSVAGAVLGEGQVSLFVAGAVFVLQ